MTVEEKLDNFLSLIDDQINYGGKKYALSNERESTDEIFDIAGYKWLIGTLMKYRLRYKNLARERDLLKIAAYCYIIWLKRGFFFTKRGLRDVIDTNLDLKKKYFSVFSAGIQDYYKNYKHDFDLIKNKMDLAYKILIQWIEDGWLSISEPHLFQVFCLMFFEWNYKYGLTEKHDTDTWNEEKKKKQ